MEQEEGGGGDTGTVLIINFVSRVNYYDVGSLVQPSNRPAGPILLPNIYTDLIEAGIFDYECLSN